MENLKIDYWELNKMSILDSIYWTDEKTRLHITVLRVPGGWIFRVTGESTNTTQTFVPLYLRNEFDSDRL